MDAYVEDIAASIHVESDRDWKMMVAMRVAREKMKVMFDSKFLVNDHV